MASARRESEWCQTASMMALDANMNRGKKHKAFQPYEFMPMDLAKKFKAAGRAARKARAVPGSINSLKAFVPGG